MTRDLMTAGIASVAPVNGGRVSDCSGALMRARGLRVALGDLVRVGPRGVRAEAVGFVGDTVMLAPLDAPTGLSPRDRVQAIAGGDRVQCSFGRVVDALGSPIDGGPACAGANVHRPAPLGAHARGRIVDRFDTGVRAIDALLTLGRGQRIAIAAPAGVGKTTLVQAIVRGAEVDAVVVALIGERGREIADFAHETLTGAARARTIIVAATSDEAPALRLRAAHRAHAIAEVLRAEGKSVLLVVDSMTRIAQAQREIGLALGEAAAMGAYPPSAFALVPRFVERAGVDRATGGAITALYTVLAEGGDADDPIVDATRAATDGHVVLSRTLAERGVYPAIDVGASLSRTMPAVVTADHMALAQAARRSWSLAEEYRELAMLGGYVAGSDAEADDALARRPLLHGLVTQGREPVAASAACALLSAIMA